MAENAAGADSSWLTPTMRKVLIGAGVGVTVAVAAAYLLKRSSSGKAKQQQQAKEQDQEVQPVFATDNIAVPATPANSEGTSSSPSTAASNQDLSPEDAKRLANEYKTKGNAAYKAKKMQEALELYQKALDVYPGHDGDCAVYHSNRAACYLYLNKNDAALKECDKALEIRPRYDKVINRRAQALERLHRLREAAHDFALFCFLHNFNTSKCQIQQQALDRVIQTFGAELAQERAKEMTPKFPSVISIRTQLDGYSIFAKRPLTSKSVEELTASLQAHPNDGTVLFERAKAHVDASNFGDAFRDLQDAVNNLQEAKLEGEVRTAYVNALCMLALLHLIRSEHEKASELLKQAKRLDRRSATVITLLASVSMDQGRADEALKQFDEAMEVDQASPDPHYQKGQALLVLQQTEAAKKCFVKAVGLKPVSYAPHVQLAVTQISSNDAPGAKNTMKQCITAFPNESLVHSYYGEVLQALGEFDPALKAFDKSLELDPKNVNAMTHKAVLLWQLKRDTAGAEKLFRQAIEADENYEGAYVSLAQLKAQAQEFDGVLDLFDKAIAHSVNPKQLVELYSLKEATAIQISIKKEYPDLQPPQLM